MYAVVFSSNMFFNISPSEIRGTLRKKDEFIFTHLDELKEVQSTESIKSFPVWSGKES